MVYVSVGVKECATHGLRRVGRAIDIQHPLAGAFMKELTYGMYYVYSEDVELELDRLARCDPAMLERLAPGWDQVSLSTTRVNILNKSLNENVPFWQKHPSVRRGLREKTDMETMCSKVN